MSEIKNVGWTWMVLNTFKCNYLTPLHFKALTGSVLLGLCVQASPIYLRCINLF